MIGCSACKQTNACTLLLVVQKKYLNKINLSTGNISENSTSTEKAKQIKPQAKSKNINELKEGWEDKPLHGKHLIGASDSDRTSSLTHQWLASSDLRSETGFHHSSTISEPTNEKFLSKHIRKWC